MSNTTPVAGAAADVPEEPKIRTVFDRLPRSMLKHPAPWQITEGQIRGIITLLLVFVFLNGTLWALLTPRWGAPDENAYFEDTRLTAKMGIVQGITGSSSTRHPPLYPLLAAGPFLLAEPYGEEAQILAIRMLGVLFLAFMVLLGFLTARELFPNQAFIPLVVAALLALMPQISFTMASINSDTLLILMATVTFWLTARILVRGLTWQTFVGLALICAAGIATKERFYLLLPMVILLLLFEIGRRTLPHLRQRRAMFTAVGGSALLAVGLGAAYLFWASPWKAALWGLLLSPQVDLMKPATVALDFTSDNSLPRFLFRQWTGLFGWARHGLSVSLYDAVELFEKIALVGLPLAGLRMAIARKNRITGSSVNRTAAYLLFALTIFAFLYATAVYQLYGAGSQGRYLLPIALPAFLLISRGLAELLPQSLQPRVWLILLVSFAFLNSAALFAFQVPVYYGGFG